MKVSQLLDTVEQLVSPELASRSVVLRRERGDDGDLVVDVDRLVRALLNFTANALDAMPEGGTLTLGARRAGASVGLLVGDTGVGIPEHLQPRLFEPFFTHGKPRGLGLGMSIARKIVEEHGGEVRLESRRGQGTQVTVGIPVEPPALAAPAAPQGPR